MLELCELIKILSNIYFSVCSFVKNLFTPHFSAEIIRDFYLIALKIHSFYQKICLYGQQNLCIYQDYIIRHPWHEKNGFIEYQNFLDNLKFGAKHREGNKNVFPNSFLNLLRYWKIDFLIHFSYFLSFIQSTIYLFFLFSYLW